MYKSPVELITKQMNAQIEDYVFNAIQEVVVNIDRDELLRALEYDRDQYERGYRDGKQANEWVSATDRLPEVAVHVLITDGKSISMGYVLNIDNDGFCPWVAQYPVSHRDVTHWMPLPKPPVEKEN